MKCVALCIKSDPIFQCIGDKAVGFIPRDVCIHDEKAITIRRLNGRVKLQTMKQIFGYTRVKVKLNVLRVHCVGHQLQEFREISRWELVHTSQKMLCQQLCKTLTQ